VIPRPERCGSFSKPSWVKISIVHSYDGCADLLLGFAMKRFWVAVCAIFLSFSLLLTSCANVPAGLSGNFRQDTLTLIESLREAIALPENDPGKKAAQADARKKLNDFFALYRRDESLRSLASFTTMQTALNSLAGHYSSYPNRPLPEKLKARLEQEFKQVELALEREANS